MRAELIIDDDFHGFNQRLHQQLLDEFSVDYPRIAVSLEYTDFIETALLTLLIRLARYKFVARLIEKHIQQRRVCEILRPAGTGGAG